MHLWLLSGAARFPGHSFEDEKKLDTMEGVLNMKKWSIHGVAGPHTNVTLPHFLFSVGLQALL